MNNPYLIQRLCFPFKTTTNGKENLLQSLSNSFSFGGGLKNGGLSNEAMSLLKDIWRYDYMGSSEFEWGAVPKSLACIAKNISEYKTGEVEVTGVYPTYNPEKPCEPTKATVYYVCRKQDEVCVCDWINRMADDKKYLYRTKEPVKLASAICKHKYSEDIAGWHDIDNHYLFFTDKKMFTDFINLFGLA